jgi:predicted transcriptional regulator
MEQVARVRELSRVLFGGARYRLEIGAALQEGDHVTITDLAETLGSPPTKASVNTEMKLLESAGLLERLPRTGRDRHVYLRAVESSYWQTCRDLAQAAAAGRLGPRASAGSAHG